MNTLSITEIFNTAWEWIQQNELLAWLMGASSVLLFIGSVLVLIIVVVKLSPDHFIRDYKDIGRFRNKHPVLQVLYLVIKNGAGVVFILTGLGMLVLPGQGLLTILIGLSLLNFPGKRRLIRLIMQRKRMLGSANWLRRKFNRPPLQSPVVPAREE